MNNCTKCGSLGEPRALLISTYIHCRYCDDGETRPSEINGTATMNVVAMNSTTGTITIDCGEVETINEYVLNGDRYIWTVYKSGLETRTCAGPVDEKFAEPEYTREYVGPKIQNPYANVETACNLYYNLYKNLTY
jgi:hypothetical protein